MCHLILAMPLLALPVFWLLPMGAAIPLYGAAVAVTAGVYVLAVKAMRKPVCTGAEDMLRAVGTVREVRGNALTVWVKSELWSAKATERVAVGDIVEVIGIEELTLRVRKFTNSNTSPRQTGATGFPFHVKGGRR
ncbi:MAG: hypothetical protein HYY78_02855 [Betaproteobacteria bacterium]|nr:hypothetical protein [Betaproteobacteria bacterium]